MSEQMMLVQNNPWNIPGKRLFGVSPKEMCEYNKEVVYVATRIELSIEPIDELLVESAKTNSVFFGEKSKENDKFFKYTVYAFGKSKELFFDSNGMSVGSITTGMFTGEEKREINKAFIEMKKKEIENNVQLLEVPFSEITVNTSFLFSGRQYRRVNGNFGYKDSQHFDFRGSCLVTPLAICDINKAIKNL